MSLPSTSPGATVQEAATSKICGLIILSFQLIGPALMLGGGKADACYCATQIRKNESPAPSPPVAPRRMQQSCSSMTCHKHEGKHTWSNTLQRGRRCLYCLREFTQQPLTEFHFRFYRAIKWSISSLPSYFVAFRCDHACSICKSSFLFFFCHWEIYSRIPNYGFLTLPKALP